MPPIVLSSSSGRETKFPSLKSIGYINMLVFQTQDETGSGKGTVDKLRLRFDCECARYGLSGLRPEITSSLPSLVHPSSDCTCTDSKTRATLPPAGCPASRPTTKPYLSTLVLTNYPLASADPVSLVNLVRGQLYDKHARNLT